MSQPFVWLCEGKFVITIFYNCPLYSFSIACCATGEQKATVVRTEQEAGIVKFYKHFFSGSSEDKFELTESNYYNRNAAEECDTNLAVVILISF